MKLSLNLIRDLLNADIIEEQYRSSGDAFDLEGWSDGTAVHTDVRELIVGDAAGLEELKLPTDSVVLCAGPAPEINVERLLAVDMSLDGIKDRIAGIFSSFELYERNLQRSTVEQRKGVKLEHMLRKLIGGQTFTRSEIEEAIKDEGWSGTGPYLCVCIYSAELFDNQRLAPYYSGLIRGGMKDTLVFEYRSYIVGVADLSKSGGTSAGFMEENVAFFRDNNFHAGLSNVFSDLENLGQYWIQATTALSVGTDLVPDIWYHRFSDRGLDYIAIQAMRDMDAEHVCAPQLLVLKEQDRINGTEYYNTLRTLFMNDMNIVKTAKDLYIHRGTMNYRLKRIVEITGLDPEDPEQRLYLEMSFRIMDIAEKMKK